MKTQVFVGVALAAVTAMADGWKPAPVALTTPWGEKVTPDNALREYPRPQFVRKDWTNLNGLWDYAVLTEKDDLETLAGPVRGPKRFDGKILVPFAPESSLSGVGRLIKPNEQLWYSRTITLDPQKGKRILLNFEAVDFRTQVFLNGTEVTDVPHEGMNVPFTVDLTDFAKPGENLLQVAVWDPTQDFIGSTGKQVFAPGGCMYTRVSGIWQTVWMETVPADYISSVKTVTDYRKGTVRFDFETALSGRAPVAVEIRRDGKTVAKGRGGETIALPQPVALWSPDEPNLYDAVFTWGDDRVESYFAVRQLELVRDGAGILRFALNGKVTYLQGTLDQGWWPDGLLTPPSEEAMAYDIGLLKDVGFNMMRKHIKVEPRRYYALCDRIGLMVLQDMPSGGGDRVKRYGFYRKELKEMVDHLQNVPSVVMWVPYNEGWGQPGAKYTIDTLAWVKRYDPTRLVNGPSGWTDYEGVGKALIRDIPEYATHSADMHNYPGPGMHPVSPNRASFLGEFGGIGFKVAGHLWKPDGNSWGYVSDADAGKSFARYSDIMTRLAFLARYGLAGSVYTQTTDVEIEVNGLATYDRKVEKYDRAKLRALHEAVSRSAETAAESIRRETTVFPAEADGWSYTTDGKEWKTGKAGFGNSVIQNDCPRARVATPWETPSLEVRRTFDWDGGKVGLAWVEMFYDEDTELFVNGVKVLSVTGYNTGYNPIPLDQAAFARALKKGRNEFSARVRQTTGGQYFDAALKVDVEK